MVQTEVVEGSADLGTTESEMYSNLAQRAAPTTMHTMSQVFDRFLVEIVPTLAKRTQSDYQGYIARLRPSFGLTAPNEVTAPDIFEFRAALQDFPVGDRLIS